MTEAAANSVLVVDDSPEQIRFVSELLRPEGCRIYAASSCEDAFHMLKKHLPNLILLDIVMPEMDGFTFCKKIKQDEQLKDIPVIFATSYHNWEYLTRGFEVGGCDYVIKPFIKEELLERVKVRIRLSQKRMELQKAYAEMDSFCYTLSHDIRAPLYVLKQLAELLGQEVKGLNDEEIQNICGMITEKAEKTASMADGLHKFSKALYETMNYSRINMNDLFQEVYQELVLLEGERKITFQKDDLPDSYGDIVLLRLVVQNVLSNALKFTEKKEEAQIHVYAEEREAGTAYCIQDNGIGFGETYASEIFGVFRRLHGEEFKGDGIGLATVKRIVDRHHGTVESYSKPFEGACIKFVLPAVEKEF